MLKAVYSRLFKQKFFNRLLLAYTMIISVTICFLGVTIISSIEHSAKQDAADSAKQAVQRISSYFGQKEITMKQLVQQLYLNPYQSRDMMAFLSQDIASYTSDDLSKADLIKYFLNASSFQDRDMMDVVIYKKNGGNLYVHSNDYTLSNGEYLNANAGLYAEMNDKFRGLKLTPTYLQSYNMNNKKRIFTISANLLGETTYNKSIAILSVNFNTDRLTAYFKEQLGSGYPIDILVLTADGQVICDTTGRYYGSRYPYFDEIQNGKQEATLDRRSMVMTTISEDLGYYVVGIMPYAEVMAKNQTTKQTVIAIATFSALIAIAVGMISVRFFSNRIHSINKAIRKVRTGDFTYRIPIGKMTDEIGTIAENFNQMCAQIVNYINKVYLSELKQKEAELVALQTQVDPHFLYNTLEIIRMEALSNNVDRVSRMIEILAQLFRRSVKEGMFVPIRDEIHYCGLYLELHSIRYEDRLTVDFHIDPTINGYCIPKHLLQPIVENCVLHGIRGEDTAPSQITLRGSYLDGDILIEITDNGCGIDPNLLARIRAQLNVMPLQPRASIGIANVHHRIQLSFGPQYGLQLTAPHGEGTAIVIRMPAKTLEEMSEHVQGDFG
ncbi:histidine kinase [Cohnella sp. GbtcB17]|uniref:sensor histidine kinase n=1 Tax=Cohnella sp. GbtcB17 TaxID=2824762 RepID=UPI001C2F1B19|nr:histidine kinase [Cohnella sp. GbtcB17]